MINLDKTNWNFILDSFVSLKFIFEKDILYNDLK